jgi:hypothetical protein
VGSASSMSALCDWAASLAWARSFRDSWDGQTYVDFLASQALRYALQARSVVGAVHIIVEIARRGRAPRFCSLASAMLGIIPRRFLERVLDTRAAAPAAPVATITEPVETVETVEGPAIVEQDDTADPVVFVPSQRTEPREFVRG